MKPGTTTTTAQRRGAAIAVYSFSSVTPAVRPTRRSGNRPATAALRFSPAASARAACRTLRAGGCGQKLRGQEVQLNSRCTSRCETVWRERLGCWLRQYAMAVSVNTDRPATASILTGLLHCNGLCNGLVMTWSSPSVTAPSGRRPPCPLVCITGRPENASSHYMERTDVCFAAVCWDGCRARAIKKGSQS